MHLITHFEIPIALSLKGQEKRKACIESLSLSACTTGDEEMIIVLVEEEPLPPHNGKKLLFFQDMRDPAFRPDGETSAANPGFHLRASFSYGELRVLGFLLSSFHHPLACFWRSISNCPASAWIFNHLFCDP